MTHRIKDGWRLYYSEEGYPYYFNEMTGESEWADVSDTTGFAQQQQKQHENFDQNEATADDDFAQADSTERDSTGDPDDESGVSTASSESAFDPTFNEKFKAFLRTPEGIEAVLAEQERIEKHVERKARKEKEAKEKEVVRATLVNKKDDDSANRGGAVGVWDAFGTFLGLKDPPSPTKSKVSKDSSKVNREKYDEFGRETKQRTRSKQQQAQSSQLIALAISQEEDLEGNASPALSPSSSSSDIESLSSDDSDVEVINAPLLSELPPWLRTDALYSRLIAPVQDFLNRHGVLTASSVIGEYVSTTGYQLASTVGQRSLSAAQQGAVTAGSMLIEWTALAWQNVQPIIVHFMENVIDAPQGNAVSTSRVTSTKVDSEASASPDIESSALTDEVEVGQGPDQDGWKALPAAPFSSPQPPLPPFASPRSNLHSEEKGLRSSAPVASPRLPQPQPLSVSSPRLDTPQAAPPVVEVMRESVEVSPSAPAQEESERSESEPAPEAIKEEVPAPDEEPAPVTSPTTEEDRVPALDASEEAVQRFPPTGSESPSSTEIAPPAQDGQD